MRLHLTILLAAASVALAQQPNRPLNPQNQPHPPQAPEFAALKAYLNLTDSQLRQMQEAGRKAGQQAQEKMRAMERQLQEKHAAFEALMAKDSNDAAALGKALIEMRATERQMHEIGGSVRASQLAVLTPEQRARFKAVEDAALLPQAARDAARLGLVPHVESEPHPQMQPNPAMRGPNRMPQGPPMPGRPN